MDDSCAVCAEPLEWAAYGACLHREVCSTCVVRLRFIMDDKRCCICKSDCPTVFVTKAMGDYTRVVTDFSVFPPDATEGRNGSYWYHEDTQGYFEDPDHYKMIKAMCRLSCSVCDRAGPDEAGAGVGPARRRNRFRSIEQLKGHLFHQHKLSMCDLCLEGRKIFICEQKLYTRAQLQQHRRTGDSEVDGTEEERSGFMGHPICDFCKSHFYGDNELYLHMSTEHYTCHICQRQHPGQYDYYRNYDDLEVHFRHEHFLCESEECLAKKFVVFQNEQELKRHNALEHGGNMSRAQRNAALQVPTSFRFRRSEQEQRRGGRFSGGRGRNFRRDTLNDILATPLHRDHGDSVAASLESVSLTSSQREQVLEQSSFPPLSDLRDGPDLRPGSTTDSPDNQDSSVSRYALALNQNSRSTNALREESFPPLPGASNRVQPGPNHAPHQGLQSLARDTLAARLQQRSKGAVKVIHPRSRQPDPPFPSLRIRQNNMSIPGLGPAPVPPNSAWSNSTSTTSTVSSSNKLKQSPPVPNLNQAGPSINPTASVTPSISNGIPVPPAIPDDVKYANSSLVERIRVGLGNDEERYSLFRGISAEYRQGDIGTLEYLSYVEQFGLSNLVPELARLLPDSQKQKELTEAYYANLRLKNLRESSANGSGNGNNGSSSKSSRKGKGKDASTDNFLETVRKLQVDQRLAQEEEKVEVLSKDGYRGSTKGKTVNSQHPGESSNSSNVGDDGTVTKQRAKKTSKFIRVRLGDGSAAALLDMGRTGADTSPIRPGRGTGTNNAGVPEGGARGVWRNGGGQQLAKDLFK